MSYQLNESPGKWVTSHINMLWDLTTFCMGQRVVQCFPLTHIRRNDSLNTSSWTTKICHGQWWQALQCVIMGTMASQITSLTIVCWTVYLGDQGDVQARRQRSLCSEFIAQRASNAENVSIWWRHHDTAINGLFISFVLCYHISHISLFLDVPQQAYYQIIRISTASLLLCWHLPKRIW